MDGKEKAQHREERRRLSVQPGVKGVVTDQVEYLIGHDAESQQGPQHKLDPLTDCVAFQPLLKVSIILIPLSLSTARRAAFRLRSLPQREMV